MPQVDDSKNSVTRGSSQCRGISRHIQRVTRDCQCHTRTRRSLGMTHRSPRCDPRAIGISAQPHLTRMTSTYLTSPHTHPHHTLSWDFFYYYYSFHGRQRLLESTLGCVCVPNHYSNPCQRTEFRGDIHLRTDFTDGVDVNVNAIHP